MQQKLSIAKLDFAHDSTDFDCGNDALNRFIKLYALQGQRANISQTYVALTPEKKIAGYHTLVVGSVVHGEAPERLKKGIPRHPIPVVILARLAVDNSEQGRGLGRRARDRRHAADFAGCRYRRRSRHAGPRQGRQRPGVLRASRL